MRRSCSGFTLAEVAVTIAIVGVVLVVSVQGLQGALTQAGHTRNIKIARELSLLTLARLESGLFEDDIEDHMQGDYAEQEYPLFTWELVLGTEEFSEEKDDEETEQFDSWADDEDEEDESESTEPWVVARVKVSFPAAKDRQSDIILERWLTREFIFPEKDDEDNPQ